MPPEGLHFRSFHRNVDEELMNDGPVLLIALIVLMIVIGIFTPKRKRRARSQPESRQSPLRWAAPPRFPYRVQRQFLSPAELSFYRVLMQAAGTRAVICPKVNLADVFAIQAQDRSDYVTHRNHIDRKHVDFLLCHPDTMQPLVAVELDDSSHERPDRQERDEFVDQVFAAAELPLLHIPARRGYVVTELAAQLTPYFPDAAQLTPTRVSTSPATLPKQSSPVAASAAPRCPKCGSVMMVRTVKSGANAGAKFWGCSTYPNCRGILRMSEA
jgi:hypothetical protein